MTNEPSSICNLSDGLFDGFNTSYFSFDVTS